MVLQSISCLFTKVQILSIHITDHRWSQITDHHRSVVVWYRNSWGLFTEVHILSIQITDHRSEVVWYRNSRGRDKGLLEKEKEMNCLLLPTASFGFAMGKMWQHIDEQITKMWQLKLIPISLEFDQSSHSVDWASIYRSTRHCTISKNSLLCRWSGCWETVPNAAKRDTPCPSYE